MNGDWLRSVHRYRPLKAVARVRIPLGLPTNTGPVAVQRKAEGAKREQTRFCILPLELSGTNVTFGDRSTFGSPVWAGHLLVAPALCCNDASVRGAPKDIDRHLTPIEDQATRRWSGMSAHRKPKDLPPQMFNREPPLQEIQPWHPEAPPMPPQMYPPAQYPPQYYPPPPVFNGPPPGYPYTPPGPNPETKRIANIGALALAVIGTAMQLGSVSLASGDSIYWIGAALAWVGFALTFVSRKTWVMIVVVILAALCAYNVLYAEKQLNDRRQQITNDLNNIRPS